MKSLPSVDYVDNVTRFSLPYLSSITPDNYATIHNINTTINNNSNNDTWNHDNTFHSILKQCASVNITYSFYNSDNNLLNNHEEAAGGNETNNGFGAKYNWETNNFPCLNTAIHNDYICNGRRR